ncbi:MAG TPA: transcriptional repressor [Patescibacteria group bacterium]|nr:transcriptional repressor [Patescibacteria group bacterium]
MVTAATASRVSSGERINAGQRAGRLEAELGSRGRRLTRQRRVIVRVMDTAQRHLDIDEIYARARKLDQHIHRVTVYRTVDMLKKLGLIDELDLLHLRGDRHYYETHAPREHIHIACLRCGKVREFESELYDEMKRQIEQQLDMKITMSRTEVGGYCRSCLPAGTRAAHGGAKH